MGGLVRQRRQDVRVHAEQQQHPGRHHGVGVQPVRLPVEQQLHGAGPGGVLLQLDHGVVRGRRPGRVRGLAVAAVPPGAHAVRGGAGRRRRRVPASGGPGGAGGRAQAPVQHSGAAHRRGAGHVQLHRERGPARGRRVHTAAVHSGHGRRRDHGQLAAHARVRRGHDAGGRVGGRPGARGEGERQLPGVRGGGGREERGRRRAAGQGDGRE